MQKSEIKDLIKTLKPVNWVLAEMKNGLMKKGLFLGSDETHLFLNEQRVMATGLMYEGKAGQVPQMVRSKVEIAELVKLEKVAGRGSAGGSKASRRS